MSTVFDIQVEVVEVRDGDGGVSEIVRTWMMLPCLEIFRTMLESVSAKMLVSTYRPLRRWRIDSHLLTKCPLGGKAPKSPPVSPCRIHSISPFAVIRYVVHKCRLFTKK